MINLLARLRCSGDSVVDPAMIGKARAGRIRELLSKKAARAVDPDGFRFVADKLKLPSRAFVMNSNGHPFIHQPIPNQRMMRIPEKGHSSLKSDIYLHHHFRS